MVSKSQLQQNDRLVQTSCKILLLLLEQSNKLQYQQEQTSLLEKSQEHNKGSKKSVITSKRDLIFGSNEIIKKISNDRSHMFYVFKYLKKIQIIKEKKRKKGVKQGIQLTSLGFEIADILYSMDKYNKIYSELKGIRKNKISSFCNRHKDKIDEIAIKKYINKQTQVDDKGIVSDNEYLKKKDSEDIKYINYISHALTSLQINEFYILISAYARIYYSYRVSYNTLLFLKNIILNQINNQFNNWVDTIVKEEVNSFTNSEEQKFEFRKLISRNLGKNYLDILKIDHSFDNEVENKVKSAIGIMLRISKPIFPGEIYLPNLDKDIVDLIQSFKEDQDLTKINYSKLEDFEKLIYLQNLAESENMKIQEFRKKLLF
jgi:hypothetical protein